MSWLATTILVCVSGLLSVIIAACCMLETKYLFWLHFGVLVTGPLLSDACYYVSNIDQANHSPVVRGKTCVANQLDHCHGCGCGTCQDCDTRHVTNFYQPSRLCSQLNFFLEIFKTKCTKKQIQATGEPMHKLTDSFFYSLFTLTLASVKNLVSSEKHKSVSTSKKIDS